MPRRYYSSTAVRTTLSGAINSSVTSISVASVSGFPGSFPYTLIIDQDQVTEEIVTVTAASGTTLTVTRGVDGTSAVAHDAGAAVNHGVSARDFDEPNDHINSSSDVHTQYVAKALIDAAGDLLVGSADNTVGRLALGSNNQVLTVDTAGSGVAKVKWADLPATGGAINTQTSDYTLALTDQGDTVAMNSSSTTTVNVPANSTVALPLGTKVDVLRQGAGAVTVNPESGVTIQNSGEVGTQVSAQWQIASLLKYATDGWVITGGISGIAARGLFGGGYNGSANSNVIDYVTIATTGNATDFGDLTVARRPTACSSKTRGVWGGGYDGAAASNIIDYVTIASAGNAIDFGDLTVTKSTAAGCSSNIRGLFAGGNNTSDSNVIDYITIATAGNATDFGDLTQARRELAGCASSTRGVFGGGNTSTFQNTIDYVTIATTGNATDFGDLTQARYTLGACSSATRGVWGGGRESAIPFTQVIDYVTIATTGNALSFGSLTRGHQYLAATSSLVRGIWAGGEYGGVTNTIDYVTIATTGNATDFGDLTVGRYDFGGCSNNHGGLA